MRYVLPLLMFIALGSFSFSARAANDDLLNATLGQAIGQFMSKAQQPGAQAVSHRPNAGRRVFHAKQLPGHKTPVTAAVPATPATPATPAALAIPAVNSAAVPATPAAAATPSGAYIRTLPTSTGSSSLPSIAPAAGGNGANAKK